MFSFLVTAVFQVGVALSTDHPKMDSSSHSSVLNHLFCRVFICLKQVMERTDQITADAMLAEEVAQKKAELAVQEPNELVVEEPKVANEAGAIVGLPGVLGGLVTLAAKSKAATPGDSIETARQSNAEGLTHACAITNLDTNSFCMLCTPIKFIVAFHDTQVDFNKPTRHTVKFFCKMKEIPKNPY